MCYGDPGIAYVSSIALSVSLFLEITLFCCMLLWLAYVGVEVQLCCVPLGIQSVHALIDRLLSQFRWQLSSEAVSQCCAYS